MRRKAALIAGVIFLLLSYWGTWAVASSRASKSGWALGNENGNKIGDAAGFSRGFQQGKKEGLEAGKKIGFDEGKTQGFQEAFKFSEKYDEEYSFPAFIIDHIKYDEDTIVARAYLYNSTAYEFTNCKLILNYNDGKGGYACAVPKLSPGEYRMYAQGNFFNTSGQKFPFGSRVVDSKFVGWMNGKKKEDLGVVFDP